ncbi:MAG TPA: extracellular solute-binding protein [candidate division Zixibacteria bacterium]|nr:extracellular solute-binding protein [candidate division Zixibacteria bacterium]
MGSNRARYTVISLCVIVILAFLVSACGSNALESPRLATQTAVRAHTPTPPGTPVISLVPTPTFDPEHIGATTEPSSSTEDPGKVLSVWINESPDSNGQHLNEMAEDFTARSGIDLDLVLIAPDLLPELVQTAAVSGTLPDVIIHPFEYSAGWSNDGILDPEAATDALDRLDPSTFDSDALDLLYLDETGLIPAIPSDGWKQLFLYRSDWFSDAELDPPDNYESILAAAEHFYQPDSAVSGIVIPTDSSLISTQRAFEHIAAANSCELVDADGEITILHPACLEALEFYRSLVNEFSPIGVQTDISSLNAFLSGRTSMIVASPAALPIIAGLDDVFKPNCPSCSTPGYLAENTGIITDLSGIGEYAAEANFGAITNVGITTNADRAAADEFVDYWFNEGYSNWIALAPERRVPMRLGTVNSPNSFIDSWTELPLENGSSTLADVYGEEITEKLSQGIATSSRWGFPERQGVIITTLHEELILPTMLQEMLSGYFTSSQTIIEMYMAIIDLIPSYEFPIEIVPTPEP